MLTKQSITRWLSAGRTRLRSANTQQLAIPRTNTGYGDRSFAVSGPSVWNTLPTLLRMSDCSLTTFRTQLKTLLFIWYIVYRQLHLLTAGQRICGLLEGILRVTNSLNNDNDNNNNTVFSERELTFTLVSSRSLYVVVCPSVVCLSVFCNVRASYSGDWNFRQCCYAIWYLGHLLTSR